MPSRIRSCKDPQMQSSVTTPTACAQMHSSVTTPTVCAQMHSSVTTPTACAQMHSSVTTPTVCAQMQSSVTTPTACAQMQSSVTTPTACAQMHSSVTTPTACALLGTKPSYMPCELVSVCCTPMRRFGSRGQDNPGSSVLHSRMHHTLGCKWFHQRFKQYMQTCSLKPQLGTCQRASTMCVLPTVRGAMLCCPKPLASMEAALYM
jgi:hypothetical protein